MSASAQSVYNNFRNAYPYDFILVYKYTVPGGTGPFEGDKLLDVSLGNHEYLRAYKLAKSSGPYMNSNEIKTKAFPFVYDTKRITDNEARHESLAASL